MVDATVLESTVLESTVLESTVLESTVLESTVLETTVLELFGVGWHRLQGHNTREGKCMFQQIRTDVSVTLQTLPLAVPV